MAKREEEQELSDLGLHILLLSSREGYQVERVNPLPDINAFSRTLTNVRIMIIENIMKNGAFALKEQMLHFP